MKFESILNSHFAAEVATLDCLKILIGVVGTTLSDIVDQTGSKRDPLLETATHFNRLNYEAIDAVYSLIKAGHLSESLVLLRWHLEMAQLFYYLEKNRDQYVEWLGGKQFKPEIIGKYFQEAGLANWKAQYEDWCNVVHSNSLFVENSYRIAAMCPVNASQTGRVRIALTCLSVNAMKIAHVIRPLVTPLLSSSDVALLEHEYRTVADIVETLVRTSNERESKKKGS